MPDITQKPCLVPTSQGFSLSYNGRFLYSKYAPQKAIVQAVQNLTLLPGTLILCASPCLWYGLHELLAKMPDGCFVLALEADAELHALAEKSLLQLHKVLHADAETLSANAGADLPLCAGHTSPLPVALLECDELLDIVEIINTGKTKHGVSLPPIHTFRRALLLEMSGGTALHADLYKQIDFAAENAIATFWKNRVTLTKLGRLFSRNVFHNLARLSRSVPLAHFLRTVTKPIVVFGAGESAGRTIASVPRGAWKQYFVLAVDAALPVLKASGIVPDAVVAVEAQLAIEKAYIGCTASLPRGNDNATQTATTAHDTAHNACGCTQPPMLFADMASRTQVTAHTGGAVTYFASEFAPTQFFSDLRNTGLLPPTFPALGSVGLTATYLALNLRAADSVPVYVTGLDFSFSLGATHTRGAPAHIARLCKTNRLMPLANYDAAFRPGAICVQGKNATVYTDQALSGYAQQFAGFFCGAKNLFDCGESGLGLGIPAARLNTDAVCTDAESTSTPALCTKSDDKALAEKVAAFFVQEKAALERLKDLLMHGEAVKSPDMTVQEEIAQILERREYLYLHFPDGYAYRPTDIAFLKRVRSEIDFFLKDLR